MIKPLDNYTKHDWLLANIHGAIAPATSIYRIFRCDYLLKDITESKNTLVNPCYETQGDDLENPLNSAEFPIDGLNHRPFKGLMAEYFSQSWSLSKVAFGTFGNGHDTIRIKCNAHLLFDRLMDDSDPFYSLFYHMGKISYEDAQKIRDSLKHSDICDFLDSAGYGLLRTVLKIRSDFRKEEEVRLVYIRSPRAGYTNPNKHLLSGSQSQFCAHHFDWRNLIEEYELSPSNPDPGTAIKQAIAHACLRTS